MSLLGQQPVDAPLPQRPVAQLPNRTSKSLAAIVTPFSWSAVSKSA